jgi:hypothetical protein
MLVEAPRLLLCPRFELDERDRVEARVAIGDRSI